MNNPFEAKGLVNQHFWLYPSHKKRRKQKNFWSGFWRKFLMENKKDCCSWCSIYSHWVIHCRKLLLDDSWLFGPKDSHIFYLLNSTLVGFTPNYNYFFFYDDELHGRRHGPSYIQCVFRESVDLANEIGASATSDSFSGIQVSLLKSK